MADVGSEVHITGSDYGSWATETTALQIGKSISELVKISARMQTDIVSQLKKNGKISEKASKAIGSGGLTTGLRKDFKEAGHDVLNLAGGFDKLRGGPLKNFGVALKKSSLGLKAGLVGIGLLGQAIGKSISVIRESTAAMRDMADSGITIAGGIIEFQDSLAKTGMTIAEAGEIMGKYSQVVGTNSFKAITNLTKSVNAANGGFMQYGLTTAEATEFTAEYLEQQRLAGIFGQASATRQKIAVQENIERLTAYSKILNVSRKHMMETVTTLKNREDVQARFATMDIEQRKKASSAFDASIQAFSALGPMGDQFGTMLTDVLGNPIAEASETFKQLAAVSPRLGKAMLGASKNIAEGIPVTAEQAKAMMNLTEQEKATLKMMSVANDAIGEMAKKLLSASLVPGQVAATEKKNQEAYAAAVEKGFEGTRDTWNKQVTESVQIAAGVDDALNILKATITAEVTTAFLHLVGADGKEGLKGAIAGINRLTENISGLSDYAKTFRDWFGDGMGGMVAAFATLTAAVSVGPMAVTAVFGLLGKGAVAAATGFKSFGIGLDKSIAGLGKHALGLAKVGGFAAAAYAGWKVGGMIYDKWGTQVQDLFNKDFANYDPNNTALTPETMKMRDDARVKRAANDVAQKKAEQTSTITTPSSSTTEPVEQVSAIDIDKLETSVQILHYTKRLVRVMESNRMMG